MVTDIILAILYICAAYLIYYGFKNILYAPSINQHLTVKELGLVEGGISNLKEIIVVADRIEEPTNELYNAVKKNIKNGVKYIFLISESKFENEKNSYWKIFQAIGESAKYNYKIENAVEIYSLNFDWEDYPCIFYRFIDAKTKKQKAFAYMGTQINEGIADEYELISPTIANKMLDFAFKGVTIPEYEKITPEELNTDLKVVYLSKTA